ncbi:hypothetical protein PC128_g2118 [Phytophthora cactorum]|nr:hypothetical protein PC128_g2118 [Phytophthora cactorum]
MQSQFSLPYSEDYATEESFSLFEHYLLKLLVCGIMTQYAIV